MQKIKYLFCHSFMTPPRPLPTKTLISYSIMHTFPALHMPSYIYQLVSLASHPWSFSPYSYEQGLCVEADTFRR